MPSRRISVPSVVCTLLVFLATSVDAATIAGTVSDVTGAMLTGTRVVLRAVASGRESAIDTGADGRFSFDVPTAGAYLVIVTRRGFSEAARTVVVESAEQKIDLPFQLELGALNADVTVTAARAERETRLIPLHVETMRKEAIEQTNPLSTGDALTMAANINPVGNGPFGVRPRLRGLDSTRLLVLVDGERLNTARQATDRTGAEVGLVSPDAISRMEFLELIRHRTGVAASDTAGLACIGD